MSFGRAESGPILNFVEARRIAFFVDGSQEGELRGLLEWIVRDEKAAAKMLYPNKPYKVESIKDLRSYVERLLEARKLRAEGRVAEALKREEICQLIYDGLPDYARW